MIFFTATHPTFLDLKIKRDSPIISEGQEGSREISGSRRGHSCHLKLRLVGVMAIVVNMTRSTSSSLISSVAGGLSAPEKC